MQSRAFSSILYRVIGRVAHIELNRPERLNAIDEYMPFEIEQAVEQANLDDSVRVSFCLHHVVDSDDRYKYLSLMINMCEHCKMVYRV